MSSLSPRLQIRVQQKQTLTPGLVQMVSLLQLNRLELKDMISAEIAQNPVLEEATEGGEELTPEELQPLLEAERVADPADQPILEVTAGPPEADGGESEAGDSDIAAITTGDGLSAAASVPELAPQDGPEVVEPKAAD